MLPLRVRVDLRAMALKGTLHSPKLQYYWSLTIRLFSVISRTLVGEVLPLCRDAVGVFYSPADWPTNLLWLTILYLYKNNIKIIKAPNLNGIIEYTFVFSLKIINPQNIDENILENLDQNRINIEVTLLYFSTNQLKTQNKNILENSAQKLINRKIFRLQNK